MSMAVLFQTAQIFFVDLQAMHWGISTAILNVLVHHVHVDIPWKVLYNTQEK